MSANVKVILETLSWTKFNSIVLVFSIFFFFFFLIVFPFIRTLGDELQGVTAHMLASPVYWFYMILVPFTANLIDISMK
jgi:hypothetical protein